MLRLHKLSHVLRWSRSSGLIRQFLQYLQLLSLSCTVLFNCLPPWCWSDLCLNLTVCVSHCFICLWAMFLWERTGRKWLFWQNIVRRISAAFMCVQDFDLREENQILMRLIKSQRREQRIPFICQSFFLTELTTSAASCPCPCLCLIWRPCSAPMNRVVKLTQLHGNAVVSTSAAVMASVTWIRQMFPLSTVMCVCVMLGLSHRQTVPESFLSSQRWKLITLLDSTCHSRAIIET